MSLPYCWIHLKKIEGVQLRDSTLPGAGKGLFAMKDFRRGDNILRYDGEELTNDCLNARYGENTAPYGISNPEGRIFDGACQRGPASMANHRPGSFNARFVEVSGRPEPMLQALRNIKRNEEIFVNYGTEYEFEGNHRTYRSRRADNRPC
jgi:hypothetical protein